MASRIRKRRAHKFVRGGINAGNPLENRMSATAAEITGLYRYPVKGLTPEPLERVALRPGETLPADRRYAIENGPSPFDPNAPAWLPKPYFLMLQRDEWLAGLLAHFAETRHVLTIHRGNDIVAEGDLETSEGREAIEGFFATAY